ncbi:MAG: ankyrin repeat domain-containing protein [Myxococcota bacterium]
MGSWMPPNDETLAGQWLWLGVQDHAVRYRSIRLEDARVQQGDGPASELDDWDELPPLSGPWQTHSNPQAARRDCRAVMDGWQRDGWVLATYTEKTEWMSSYTLDNDLLGIGIEGCSPSFIARMHGHQVAQRAEYECEQRRDELDAAVRTGTLDEIQLVLERMEAGDVWERHVTTAVQRGDVDIAALLFDRQGPIEEWEHEDGPLALACRLDRPTLVSLLLDHGSSTERTDGLRRTPLHQAVAVGATRVVRILVRHGCKTDPRDANGVSPIELAAREGLDEIFDVLASEVPPSQYQQALASRDEGRARALRRAQMHPYTGPLLWAAYRGFTDSVLRLLDEEGVPVNTAAPDGRNALYMAVMGEHEELEALLRARGAVEP